MNLGVAFRVAAPLILWWSRMPNFSVKYTIPPRALAFRSDVALEKLHEYFASEKAQRTASVTSGMCIRCGAHFSVVLANKNDAGNQHYRGLLCRLIGLACYLGKHEDEYVLREH